MGLRFGLRHSGVRGWLKRILMSRSDVTDDSMSGIECETVYFDERGKGNTDRTLELAKKRADELGIRDIVVASYTGWTGLKASDVFQGYNLVVVTGMVGYSGPNVWNMDTENKRKMEESGAKLVTSLHAFGTLGRAIKNKFGAIQVDEIIAHVLRLFSQGVKVGCECACMACDAGLITSGKAAISIGGAGGGADTAIVLKPANTHRFFDTRIHEIICKPR